MKDDRASQYCYENAELRQRVSDLEKENTKLKRKLKMFTDHNDPRNQVLRKIGRGRFTD